MKIVNYNTKKRIIFKYLTNKNLNSQTTLYQIIINLNLFQNPSNPYQKLKLHKENLSNNSYNRNNSNVNPPNLQIANNNKKNQNNLKNNHYHY